jgi:hypothetical protein
MVPNPDGRGLKKVMKKVGDQGNLDFTRVYYFLHPAKNILKIGKV